MTTADHGGFDFAVEIAENTVTFVARSLTLPQSGPQPLNVPEMQGQIFPSVTISDTTLTAPETLSIKLNLQGTNLRVTQIILSGVAQPIPAWMQNIELRGTVTINDRLQIVGNALVIDYTADPTRGTPEIVLALDESTILASPLMQFILGQAILTDPTGTTYLQRRAQILTTIRTETVAFVQRQITALGVLTLVPSPPPPPPPVSGVTSAKFKIGDRAIHMLYHTCGSGGIESLITRSTLLRRTSDMLPLDVTALIISNAGFLGCVLNPVITMALGLSPGGFVPGHPLLWFGRSPLTIPGGLPSLISGVFVTRILAGIDGTNVRLLANLTAVGVGGSFTINAAIDTTFSLTATAAGRSVRLAIAPLGTPSVSSDINIAWWVYVGGYLAGGIALAGVMAAIDSFGRLILDGLIATAVAGILPSVTLPFSLPPSAPPVSVRAQSLSQSDALTRTVIAFIGGLAFPIVDPFQANDIIINLV